MAALTVAAAGLAACSDGATGASTSSRQVHEEGDGPLSMKGGSGFSGLLAPRGDRPWTASFGSLLPCVTGGEPARIERVRYDLAVEPESVHTGVREHPVEQGGLIAMEREAITDDKYFVARWWHPDATGWVVTDGCDRRRSGSELVTVMRAGDEGAWIRRTLVDYSSGGHEYTLVVRWQDVMCGRATRASDACRG